MHRVRSASGGIGASPSAAHEPSTRVPRRGGRGRGPIVSINRGGRRRRARAREELLEAVGRADLGATLAAKGDARVAALLEQLEGAARPPRAPVRRAPRRSRATTGHALGRRVGRRVGERRRSRARGRFRLDRRQLQHGHSAGVPRLLGGARRRRARRRRVAPVRLRRGRAASTVSALAPAAGPALAIARAADVDVIGPDRVRVTPAGAARVIVARESASVDAAAIAAAVVAEAEAAGARSDGAPRRSATFTISYLSDALRIIRADDGSAAVFSRAARPQPR